MFEGPEYTPPDLLLLQCDEPTKLYGIRVNPQAYMPISMDANKHNEVKAGDDPVPERPPSRPPHPSLTSGSSALILDTLTLSLLLWQRNERAILKGEAEWVSKGA